MKAKEIPKVLFQQFSIFCRGEELTIHSQGMVFVAKGLNPAQAEFSGEIGLYEDKHYSCFVVWEGDNAEPVIKIDYKVGEPAPAKVKLDTPLDNLVLIKFICKVVQRAAELTAKTEKSNSLKVKHDQCMHPSL